MGRECGGVVFDHKMLSRVTNRNLAREKCKRHLSYSLSTNILLFCLICLTQEDGIAAFKSPAPCGKRLSSLCLNTKPSRTISDPISRLRCSLRNTVVNERQPVAESPQGKRFHSRNGHAVNGYIKPINNTEEYYDSWFDRQLQRFLASRIYQLLENQELLPSDARNEMLNASSEYAAFVKAAFRLNARPAVYSQILTMQLLKELFPSWFPLAFRWLASAPQTDFLLLPTSQSNATSSGVIRPTERYLILSLHIRTFGSGAPLLAGVSWVCSRPGSTRAMPQSPPSSSPAGSSARPASSTSPPRTSTVTPPAAPAGETPP